MINTVLSGLLIPFIGTAAGAGCVFFLKNDLKENVQKALSGFAAGVMVAASIWSLIVPAIDQCAEKGRFAFLPAFIGFWIGILFLLLLDHVIPHLHVAENRAEGPKSHLTRVAMLVFAVTLHNIPEGMAVGVVYAGLLSGSANITAGGALALALGMSPTLQMANHTELHRRRNSLDQILEEHPELKEDEEFSKQLTRFDALRTELIGAASKYNESARIFNGYIEKPFASFIAAKKTKGTKSFFSHELAEVTAK